MKIHTDELTQADLHRALPPGIDIELITRGTRSRARAWEFRLAAEPGPGRRKRNDGYYGAEQVRGVAAATWDEHGQFFAALFERDPDAIIGPYKGRDDFHTQTCGKYRAGVTA